MPRSPRLDHKATAMQASLNPIVSFKKNYMNNINRNQTELWCFVNPSHLLHINLHRRGLAAKSSSFWNIYVLMPYPITIFKSQPFSDQFSTLITADQCLTLWYMFSHNWRSRVLSFAWSLSTIFQYHYVKRIMGYVGLIRCPIWLQFTRSISYKITSILKAIVSKRHCKREVLGTRLRSCASSIIFVKLKKIEKKLNA